MSEIYAARQADVLGLFILRGKWASQTNNHNKHTSELERLPLEMAPEKNEKMQLLYNTHYLNVSTVHSNNSDLED